MDGPLSAPCGDQAAATWHEHELRWSDVDRNGHANNVALLSLMDDVRRRSLPHPTIPRVDGCTAVRYLRPVQSSTRGVRTKVLTGPDGGSWCRVELHGPELEGATSVPLAHATWTPTSAGPPSEYVVQDSLEIPRVVGRQPFLVRASEGGVAGRHAVWLAAQEARTAVLDDTSRWLGEEGINLVFVVSRLTFEGESTLAQTWLDTTTTVVHAGNSSLGLQTVIDAPDDPIGARAVARALVVAVDPDTQAPIALTRPLRSLLAERPADESTVEEET